MCVCVSECVLTKEFKGCSVVVCVVLRSEHCCKCCDYEKDDEPFRKKSQLFFSNKLGRFSCEKNEVFYICSRPIISFVEWFNGI